MRLRLQKEFVEAIQQIHVVASVELFLSPAILGGERHRENMEYSEIYYIVRVKIILLLSVPVTVPTKLSEQPELLKHHVGLCFGWHI